MSENNFKPKKSISTGKSHGSPKSDSVAPTK